MNTPSGLTLSLALLILAPAALAGPLDPPPGPVAATYKTLQQVEPRTPIGPDTTPGDNDASPSTFKITQPGSYVLTSNIAGEPSKHAIEIAANNVTIDLRGFSITGAGLDGIYAENWSGIEIRAGFIRSAGADGIDLRFANNARIHDMTVADCAGSGIRLGAAAIIERCTADGCADGPGAAGILVGQDALVLSCIVRNSGDPAASSATGMLAGARCRVRDCIVSATTASGAAVGIAIGFDTVLEHCSIVNVSGGAGSAGVNLGGSGTVRDSNFSSTPVAIIATESQCSILGNTINGTGGIGIRGASTSALHIEDNRFENLSPGVQLNSGRAVIVRNVFRSVPSPATNPGPGSVIGPTVTVANIGASTNPHSNVAY